MKPSSIAFADADCLGSVHGAGSVLGARIAAVGNLMLPVHLRRKTIVSSYAEFDVAVTARNPFLAAFVIKQATEQGLRCVVVPGGAGEDEWPYDLLMSRPVGELLVGVFGDEGIENNRPVALQLIDRFLRAAPNDVVVASAFGAASLSRRQPSSSLALFGSPSVSDQIEMADPALRSLAAGFRVGAKRFGVLEPPHWGQTAIFCKTLAATGMAAGLGSVTTVGDGGFQWSNPRVRPLGSAAMKPRSLTLAAEAMTKMLRELPKLSFSEQVSISDPEQ